MELIWAELGKLLLPHNGPHYSFGIEQAQSQLPLARASVIGTLAGVVRAGIRHGGYVST